MSTAATENSQVERNTYEPEHNGIDQQVGAISFHSLIWPILLSLLVLFIIGWINYEPGTLALIGRSLDVGLLGAGIVILAARVVFGGWRLYYISHGHMSFRRALRGQLLWDFASNVTPSLIGGGPVAAILVSRDSKMPLGEVTSVMLFAMLLDQVWFAIAVVILLVASLFVNVYPDSLGTIGSAVFTLFFLGMLVWTVLFAYATLVRPGILQTIVARVTRIPFLRRFRRRADAEMENLKDRAALLRSGSPAFFANGLLLTVATWLCRYVSLLFLVWALYAALPKVDFFFRTMAMLTGALLMPTPGGSGGIEGMYALFFSALMPRPLIAPSLLAWRFLAYYVFVGIGVFLSAQVLKRTIVARSAQGS